MNADPVVQLRLLELQAADTALAQLAHRRTRLPELVAIGERQQAHDSLQHAVIDARTRVEDIAAEQRRLEADVETVRARATRDEARLQAGGLPARELSSLQHEIATLARRQSTLEDEILEVMERAEQAEAELADATHRQESANAELAELSAKRDAAFAEIDTAAAERAIQRNTIAADVPADVLALYERARTQGGTGAALLRLRRCDGCHMELSGTELSAMRNAAPDLVMRCDNCRAILVRTAESGL